jgi:hypothetical protein
MKKTSLLKFFCSVLSVVLLMSSCLGDGDSSFTIEKDFAYIVENDYGQKYAVTSNGYIMHENITKLTTVGSCYFIDYKITSTSADGYHNAEYVRIWDDGKAIPKTDLLYSKPYSNLQNQNDTITPAALDVQAWASSDIVGDNWSIAYKMTQRKGDKIEAFFYYDKDNQKDAEGEIGDNRIIIDIRFGITDRGTNTDTESNTYYAVGNLKSIRNGSDFVPKYDGGTNYVDVPVKFRYQKFTSTGQAATIEYIGSWTKGGSSYRFVQFTK